MSRRPHPDGGPDIRDDEPQPPPFPVGTRLRMKPGPDAFDAFVRNPELDPREGAKRENLIRIRGAGMEVVISKVTQGYRGTGRLMETHDDGYEVFSSTKNGYSVYVATYADGREIRHSGRCIDAEDADQWEVLSDPLAVTKPMRAQKPDADVTRPMRARKPKVRK